MRSLMPFTLPDNPQFYGVGVFLPNILIIGLFVSNSRMVILFRTKKNSHHSKHSMDHLFMTMARGGLVTCFQILLFLSKISTVHFYGWKEWGAHKIGHFVQLWEMYDPYSSVPNNRPLYPPIIICWKTLQRLHEHLTSGEVKCNDFNSQ